MFKRVICVYLVVLICLIASVAHAKLDFVGIWSSYDRTTEGFGSQIVFTEDGKVYLTFGTLLDYKYAIQDNTITLTPIGPDNRETRGSITSDYKLNGDTLIMTSPTSTAVQSMKRVKISSKLDKLPPIVGNWTYTYSTGDSAHMRFSSHGIVQLSVISKFTMGTYRMEHDELFITFSGKKSKYGKNRTGDTLLLTDNETNKTDKYVLFEY